MFGIKGGAAGGGYSQVVPMEEINLHFTGDFHAISSAHALLSAVLDNHLYRPNTLGIDPTRITWPRTIDMNDRAMRDIVVGLGGHTGGVPRQDGFVITAASAALSLGDVVVTEAGFGADLGAEKFFAIKCRFGRLRPGVAVVVATVRALKMNGGVSKNHLGPQNVEAVKTGLANLQAHVEIVRKFGGLPPISLVAFIAAAVPGSIKLLRIMPPARA